MLISIITLFPEMFSGVFDHSISKRAIDEKRIKIEYVDLRSFGIGKHRVVDDTPYGGGIGMVLKVDVLHKAIEATKKGIPHEKVILLDPKGKVYEQKEAEEYAKLSHLILICGRYEGVDARVEKYIDEIVSIGDYVLSGGEIAAMAITDSIIRLIPGVLRKDGATAIESFSDIKGERLLEPPQYTRPEVYEGMSVPKILLSGDPQKIQNFNTKETLKLTKQRRPDLLKRKKPIKA